MSLIFTPGGMLNVACDASDLPESGDATNSISDAMVRCKNLRINQKGVAKTRDGSAKLNETATNSPVWWIEEQGGTRYAFAGGSIYADEVEIESSLTPAQWSAIQYNAFNDTTESVFALNGTDRKRIADSTVYEWGLEAPTISPALSAGSATGLTGDYRAKYTYVRKVDGVTVAESNPSPVSALITLADTKLTVSITQPTDSQVTHIRLYRTAAGGVLYNLDQDIAVGTTSFTSSAADSALGDELETDHDRPPLGSFVTGPAFDGTCFIILDNRLYYCKPKQPEYWPALYYIEVGPLQFPGRCVVFHNGQPFYLSTNEIYYIQGTGAGTFFPLPMKSKTGAQSARGAVSVAGKGIYHTGPDGIYLFSSGTDTKVTEDNLEPLFRGESVQGMPAVADMTSSWLHVFRNHLYFGYRSSGDTWPVNVLVMNLETMRTSFYEYGFEISAIATDETNKRLLTGDLTGFVRVIENPTYTDDSGTAIEYEVQSKDFTLQTRKHFPRWVKYDVDASAADTCTGALILEDAVHASHPITGNRQTRRRLVEVGNGNRAAIRISGTGPVSIYAAESE
jgi:hypothetical protein